MGAVGEADPLFAKNILWWFGHPVVYLLLFPAAAAYYWLDPPLRRAGARRGQCHRDRVDDRRDRERHRVGAPHLPRLPRGLGPGRGSTLRCSRSPSRSCCPPHSPSTPSASRSTGRPSAGRLRPRRCSSGSSGGCSRAFRGSSTPRSHSTSSSTTPSGSSGTSTTWRCSTSASSCSVPRTPCSRS